ncbi:MAG: class I SAM-dependent methyltransferase [Victivallaceae bacterium]|nr:class I SAM-dependent methyltransferase [Victivallaceae bacterium]
MTSTEKKTVCPLCISSAVKDFYQDKIRTYLCCQNCNLIFVPQEYFLTETAEKAEYDLHRNSPADQGYRKFLSRLFIPMQELLSPASHGLDFGSGPGPTLSVMFEESGHSMDVYDKIYADIPERLEQRYDFITATEVVEHLQTPKKSLEQLWQCLKPDGYLGIMTKLARDREAFANWHYKNDLTHITFFSRKTFIWLAEKWHAELKFIGKDVIILRRSAMIKSSR